MLPFFLLYKSHIKLPKPSKCPEMRNFLFFSQALSKDQLLNAVIKRVHDSVGRYKGQFQHWDVNNEYLHGQYFEEALKDPNFSASMFRLTQRLDPKVLKFVNDYNIIEYYYDPLSSPALMLEVRLAIQGPSWFSGVFSCVSDLCCFLLIR